MRPARPLEEVDVPGYRGPERRSGKHSPYGDELFRMMREQAVRMERIEQWIRPAGPQLVLGETQKEPS